MNINIFRAILRLPLDSILHEPGLGSTKHSLLFNIEFPPATKITVLDPR